MTQILLHSVIFPFNYLGGKLTLNVIENAYLSVKLSNRRSWHVIVTQNIASNSLLILEFHRKPSIPNLILLLKSEPKSRVIGPKW